MAHKRSILVTGCSDGSIGSALAMAFHRAGWRVFATARNLAKVTATTKAGIEAPIQLDVTSPESIAACVEEVRKRIVMEAGAGEGEGVAKLDALLNNAGAGYSMPFLDLDLQKLRDLFELNVISVVAVTQAFAPLLLASPRGGGGGGGGLVINVTSISAVFGLPFQSAYNATKSAAAALTEALRLETAPFGLRVVELLPGWVRSNFYENTPRRVLPPGSRYLVRGDEQPIEKFIMAENAFDGALDPDVWAAQVVRELTATAHPPRQVWGSKMTLGIRIGNLLPRTWLDGTVEKRVGLDIFRRILASKPGGAKN
ncbi:hypothetical protein BX600DRAFT_475442 [Xylariales sp. PMI_506]|nr:hypothetical protein BX600DRAFT_475442 [Xylariales sp. PMI_506]